MVSLGKELRIVTREMHTGGEPVRIIEQGYPAIPGDNILEKRAYVKANLDHLRQLLMFEPRGHYDMYGALLVKPTREDADLAVLFMDNKQYSTMCGHVVLALSRYAVDSGIIKRPVGPETPVRIQCPCGLVKAYTEYDEQTGKTGATRFQSVPSFAFKLDHLISLPGGHEVHVDVAYGGAFYAIVPGEDIGVDVFASPIAEIVQAAAAVKAAVVKSLPLHHPDSPDLAFLYGVIVTNGNKENSPDVTPASLVVFADSQVDRSPCGSGTTARMAAQYARSLVQPGQQRTFINAKTRSAFHARVVDVLDGQGRKGAGGREDAVIVEVKGNAYYTGAATFTAEEDDPVRAGFLVK